VSELLRLLGSSTSLDAVARLTIPLTIRSDGDPEDLRCSCWEPVEVTRDRPSRAVVAAPRWRPQIGDGTRQGVSEDHVQSGVGPMVGHPDHVGRSLPDLRRTRRALVDREIGARDRGGAHDDRDPRGVALDELLVGSGLADLVDEGVLA